MCERKAVDGAIHFVCMDWRHVLMRAGTPVVTELKNLCVRLKSNARRILADKVQDLAYGGAMVRVTS